MFRILIVFLIVFALILPVAAQDAPAPVVTPEVAMSAGELLLYLGLAILGGGGIMAVLTNFLSRRESRDVAEKLYQSASPETQRMIKELVERAHEVNNRVLDFLDAVTDGQPNT